MSADTHVIVGAGLAGAKAAEALREEGFEGRIVLIGDEPELPYERPPLSKDYLRGESPREKARVHPDAYYDEHGVELRTETVVEGIDAGARNIELRGGERLSYDRLLLVTGAEPAAAPAARRRAGRRATTCAISPTRDSLAERSPGRAWW